MSELQIILGLLLDIAAIIAFNSRNRQEEKLLTGHLKPGLKTAFVEPLLLPALLAVISAVLILMRGTFLLRTVFAQFVLLFVYISIYYAVLLLLLPLLRRIISARACATLWMVPTLLYFSAYYTENKANPLLLITLPQQWLALFASIWAAGFAAVSARQAISHFSYRRFLLKNSEELTDARILSAWHSASKRHGVRAKIPVRISDAVSTPLTIGCFERTMVLILPAQSYSDEEYALIFRHELRHILWADTRTKLFMSFFTAVCWFNPLASIAWRKAADDLELSCDEAVLEYADEPTRRLYAGLLLKNAGISRGYTTSLSNAAKTVRYRLHNIVKPVKRFSGGAIIGLAAFMLIMALNTVALADSPATVQYLIFDKAPAGMVVDSVAATGLNNDPARYRSVYGWNERALTEYIASLRVKQVYAGHYNTKESPRLYVDYAEIGDAGAVSFTRLTLCDGLIFANIPCDDRGEITYILDEEIDWGRIESSLDFDAENPDPPPFPPDMMMFFNDDINPDGKLMYAAKNIISIQSGGELEINEYLNSEGAGGVSGYPVTQVKLFFSYAPASGYEVRVENLERTQCYTLSSQDLENDIIPLAPYDAHYTVSGTFKTVRDTTYEMEFSFDIDLP